MVWYGRIAAKITLTFREAKEFNALPWPLKMAALACNKSFRCIPGPRGLAPINKASSPYHIILYY
jgi:hypothetical protein